MNLFSNQMGMMIIYGISTLIFQIDCCDTERITCEPEMCQHGICYRTTNSITAGGEKDSRAMQCPDGFDNYKRFCFKMAPFKESWFEANDYSEQHGSLAIFFNKEDVNTAAEYLRSKISVNQDPVWASLLFDNANALPYLYPPCTALEPTNYTRWKIHLCTSELYSLRTDTLSNPTPTYDIMCRCHPGYTGKSCDVIDSKNMSQELTNPETLLCPSNTVIHVQFALDGYEAKDTTGMDSFATSTLAILRSECQGKKNCSVKQYHKASEFYNKLPKATLSVRHSCTNASDMYCPSSNSSFRIEDDKSVNCILLMDQNVLWHMAYYYCFQKGGHLASFNGGIHSVNFSLIAKMLKPSVSFWTSDELPDNKGDDEWAMAITNDQYNTPNVPVPTELSELLPGICVIPPRRQAIAMVDTTMKIAYHNATYPTSTSIHSKIANNSVDTIANLMTLNIITILGSTICLTVWISCSI